ncbi:unnamed protein product, partial [Aphanomyces euteiches]
MAPKRWAMSWDEHIVYLRHLQRMSASSDAMVLDMFCKYSCPQHTPSLIACVDLQNKGDPNEMEKALKTLIALTGTGVNFGKNRPNPSQAKPNYQGRANMAHGGRGGGRGGGR